MPNGNLQNVLEVHKLVSDNRIKIKYNSLKLEYLQTECSVKI